VSTLISGGGGGATKTRDRMGLVGIDRDPVPDFSIWHFWIPGPGFLCYRDHLYYLGVLPVAINESDAMYIAISRQIDLLQRIG